MCVCRPFLLFPPARANNVTHAVISSSRPTGDVSFFFSSFSQLY